MKIPLGKNNLQTSQTNHIANCIVSTQHEPLTETRFPNSHSVVTEKYSLKIAFQKSRQNSSRIHVKEFHTYDYNFTSNKRLHRYFSKILFIILNHLSLYFQVFFIFFFIFSIFYFIYGFTLQKSTFKTTRLLHEKRPLRTFKQFFIGTYLRTKSRRENKSYRSNSIDQIPNMKL